MSLTDLEQGFIYEMLKGSSWFFSCIDTWLSQNHLTHSYSLSSSLQNHLFSTNSPCMLGSDHGPSIPLHWPVVCGCVIALHSLRLQHSLRAGRHLPLPLSWREPRLLWPLIALYEFKVSSRKTLIETETDSTAPHQLLGAQRGRIFLRVHSVSLATCFVVIFKAFL